MADTRIFFKMDVGYFRNPKIMTLLEECPSAVFVHMAAIAYSREHLTDGVVQMRRVMADVLVNPCGSHCGSECDPQCARIFLAQYDLITPLDERRGRVHDYGEHNQTRAQVDRAKSAGQAGADARWNGKRSASGSADRIASGSASGSAERNAEKRRGEESNKSTPRAASPDRFAEFWDLYPKKAAKGDARRAWAKAIKSTDPEVIIEAVTAQLPWFASQLKPDGDFRPGAGPWLNQERWTDEIAQPIPLMSVGNYDAYRDAPRPSKPVFHDDE